jgi:hypothetical protein
MQDVVPAVEQDVTSVLDQLILLGVMVPVAGVVPRREMMKP